MIKNGPEHRERISTGAKLWWQNPENRAKVTTAHSGPEFSRKISIAKKGKPGHGSRKCATACQCKRHNRKPISEESHERMRQVQRARAKLPEVQEHLKKMTELASLPEARLKQQAYLQNPEIIEMYRQNLLARRMPQKLTSIEIKLRDAFIKAGLSFEMHKPFVGRFQPDFMFTEERILVEADSIYWHSKPERVEADNRKDTIAAEMGWRVLRFTDRRINKELIKCVSEVKEALLSQS